MEFNKTDIKLHVKASKTLKKRLRVFFIKNYSYKDFAQKHSISQKELSRWVCGKRGTPLQIVQEFADSININIKNVLDNELLSFERSKYSFKFNKEISIFEMCFLGWFLSEGHMEKNGKRISIDQNDETCLINIKNQLKEKCNVDGVRLVKDRHKKKLRISNAPFTNYLIWRYNLNSGKKAHIIRLPDILFNLSNEHKFAFLAGFLEGDGCFNYYYRNNKRKKYKVPRIFITSCSFKALRDMQRLYRQIGIDSKINSDGEKQKPHHHEKFKLNVLKANDCVKLAFYIYPYLLHPEKRKKIVKIFQDKEILNAIRINGCKELLNKFRIKYNLKRNDLSKYFYNKLSYQAATSTINGWLNNTYRSPLSIVLHCCDVLDQDALDYIPKEYVFLLSVMDLVPWQQFINIRKDFAKKINAKKVIFLGNDEIESKLLTIKDQVSGDEKKVKLKDIVSS